MTLLLRHMSAGCTRFLQWRDSTVWFRFRFQFGNLVHILQRERDWTALFLSSIGSETTIFLRDRYSTTDQALALMTLWPDDVEDVSTGGKHGIGRKFYHFYKISVTGYAEPRLILKTFSASSDENFIKMTAFSFHCRALTNFPNYSLTIFWYFLTTRCLRYGCSITASARGGGGGGGGGGVGGVGSSHECSGRHPRQHGGGRGRRFGKFTANSHRVCSLLRPSFCELIVIVMRHIIAEARTAVIQYLAIIPV